MAEGDLAWEALADPTRRSILRVLGERGELAAGEIAAAVTTVGRTAVSAQLRVLRSSGLIAERRVGTHRFYSVQPGAADEVVQFLAALYRGSLGALKEQVEGSRTEPRADKRGSASAG